MIQTLIVLSLIAAAALYLGVRIYRTARSARSEAGGCAHGCGCGGDSSSEVRHTTSARG